MASRMKGLSGFLGYFFRQPYLFGLVVGAAFLVLAPGDWMLKGLAVATGLLLCIGAAYLQFRALARREAEEERTSGE